MANAPGKHYRKGITLVEAAQKFGDDAKAEAWFVERRWPNGIRCPKCDSDAVSTRKGKRQTPQYHCKACTANFTVKTDTIMHNSKLSLGKWALAFYLYSTNLKGVSSMKLHRELGISQKSAWHLAHRIREVWNGETERMAGPVEADEAYFGGKAKNMHAHKRAELTGRGGADKPAVAGIKDRETNQAKAQVVERTDARTLQGFVTEHTDSNAQVYTDEASAYQGLNRPHGTVKHSVSEYVNGMAHTNGIESFWTVLKRGYHGTYHKISPKHLGRYVTEFAGRHNVRRQNTQDQLAQAAASMSGKRLTYCRAPVEEVCWLG